MAKLTKEQFLKLASQAVSSGSKQGRKHKLVAFLKAEIASGNKQIACISQDDLGLSVVGRYEVKNAIKACGIDIDKLGNKLGFVPAEIEKVEGYNKEKAFILDLS